MDRIKIAAIVLSATLSTSCSAKVENSVSIGSGLSGSGNSKTELRKLEPYHAVELDLPAELGIKVGSDKEASITTDDNLLSHITSKVTDGKLRITSDTNINDMHNLKIVLQTSKLDSIKINGAGKVSVGGLSGGNLNVSCDGAADLNASGKLDEFDASLNGAGSVNAPDLQAKKVKVSVNGAGSAVVNASDELNASITGAGSVKYKGDPKVQQQITGVGTVEKM